MPDEELWRGMPNFQTVNHEIEKLRTRVKRLVTRPLKALPRLPLLRQAQDRLRGSNTPAQQWFRPGE